MIDSLKNELVRMLGPDGVATDDATLAQAARDGSYLSPIVAAKLASWPAPEIVATPSSVEELAETVSAAVRAGVPITPRGRGTSNYGQVVPMRGGLVINTRRLSRVVEVADGSIRAEAGATMLALERAALREGQELWLYPSTVNSSLGGFLAGGSGGTGSIEHGMVRDGFVESLTVVLAREEPTVVEIRGEATRDYLHRYGTVGILAAATVRLDAARPWTVLYGAFDSQGDALRALRRLCAAAAPPRLVSVDPAELAAALPQGPDVLTPGAASLRGIVAAPQLGEAIRIVEEEGGRVTRTADSPTEVMRVSTTSYNHAIEWLQKSAPGRYFHLETFGPAVIDRLEELAAVYPEGLVHVEGLGGGRAIGLLAARYQDEPSVYAGFDAIAALGIGIHNPHQWFVDVEPEATRGLAAQVDPSGLLNPGRLAVPDVPTRVAAATEPVGPVRA